MKNIKKSDFVIKEVRTLANAFSLKKLSACLDLAITNTPNPCFCSSDNEITVSTLAKASFVRKQVEQGMSLPEAMRELANRIRAWA